jgi:hypothetical protein
MEAVVLAAVIYPGFRTAHAETTSSGIDQYQHFTE